MSSPSSLDPAPADQIGASGGPSACGACGVVNPSVAPFCAGCGHALQEPCGKCTQPVQLSQAFCGNCGNDLKAAVARRRGLLETKVADAIVAAKERDFERATGLLAVVTREKDFRFRDVVAKAEIARSKVDSVAIQESASASERLTAAKDAFGRNDLSRVIELLDSLPKKLLTPDAETLLKTSRDRLRQTEQAEASLHEAFEKRDWAAAGVILDTVMGLKPDDAAVAKLARKVGAKLIKNASALCESHKYSAAGQLLDCVPANSRDQAFTTLCETVNRMQWLSSQFDGEPLCTPTLGRLAKRWVEDSAGDPKAGAMLKRISETIKGPRRDRRNLFAPLEDEANHPTQGAIGILAHPECIDIGKNQTFRANPGQFNVAIGLALQGLGLGRVNEDFTTKKGLLKRLGRKKTGGCWGPDIGSWAIKAVRLEKNGEGLPALTHCEILPLDNPLTRDLTDEQTRQSIGEAVARFVDRNRPDSDAVWAGIPARELVSRFIQLPPVPDKQAKTLFENEMAAQIPLPLDEISRVTWLADRPTEQTAHLGRPALVAAAKQQFVNRYLETLEGAGLTVTGLQATSIALVNFLAEEFRDLLSPADPSDDAAASDDPRSLPTVTYFDCGAEMTTVLRVNSRSSWFWTFESGGNEFTRLLCRSTKVVHSDAERLKRHPAELVDPATQYGVVEQRIDEIRTRIDKAVSQQTDGRDGTDGGQSWCGGGGVFTHGWIKRVLCGR